MSELLYSDKVLVRILVLQRNQCGIRMHSPKTNLRILTWYLNLVYLTILEFSQVMA
jgi:hypothetical protein